MASELKLRHTPKGTPYVRLYIGTSPVTKRAIRPYKEFPGMTDEEALAAAKEWCEEVRGTFHNGLSQNLRDMLTRYISHIEANNHSYNTVKTYRLYARRYVAPLEELSVSKITSQDLDDLFTDLLTRGPNGDGALAPHTVVNLRWFLKGAFERFVRLGLITSNPVKETMKPEEDPREAYAMDEESVSVMLEEIINAMHDPSTSASNIRLRNVAFAAFLALNTGCRCGEVCAIRREDVRLATRVIRVNGTVIEQEKRVYRQPKTKGKKSRTVAAAPDLIQAILQHEEWQQSYLVAKADTPLVTVDGKYVRPSYVSRKFTDLRKALGLDPSYTFHSLRHTHATWLLQSGVNIREIQERLGHAYVSTTLSTYGHVLPGRDMEAARQFEQATRRVMREKRDDD